MIPPKQNVKQKSSGAQRFYKKASITLSKNSMIKYAAVSIFIYNPFIEIIILGVLVSLKFKYFIPDFC